MMKKITPGNQDSSYDPERRALVMSASQKSEETSKMR